MCRNLIFYTIKWVESYKFCEKILNCNAAYFQYVTSLAEKNWEIENLFVNKRKLLEKILILGKGRKIEIESLVFLL